MKTLMIFIDVDFGSGDFVQSPAFTRLAGRLENFQFVFFCSDSGGGPKIDIEVGPGDVFCLVMKEGRSKSANGLFEKIYSHLIQSGCCDKKIIINYLGDPRTACRTVECSKREPIIKGKGR